MKQVDFQNAVGRTLTEVYRLSESQCLVVFDDATYCKIEGSGDEDWDGLDTLADFNLLYRSDLWPTFLEIGLLSQSAIDARVAAQKMADECDKGFRRAQYENLKKEFGNECDNPPR